MGLYFTLNIIMATRSERQAMRMVFLMKKITDHLCENVSFVMKIDKLLVDKKHFLSELTEKEFDYTMYNQKCDHECDEKTGCVTDCRRWCLGNHGDAYKCEWKICGYSHTDCDCGEWIKISDSEGIVL